jgi:phage baseplate assembly protein W
VTQIAYPYAVDKLGRTAASDEERHVRELMEQVLLTMPGERVNRPNFGTPVMQLVFEPNSDVIATAVQASVQAALQQQLGGRIQVERVDITNEKATLGITVVYSVRRTGQRTIAQFTREV